MTIMLHHATLVRIEGASYRLGAHTDLRPEHVRINSEISPRAKKKTQKTAEEGQKIYKG